MLERLKISPSQQPRSLGISPSDLASKSLGLKIENGEVTWGKHSSDLGFKIGDRKRAQFTPLTMIDGTPCHDRGHSHPHGWMHAHIYEQEHPYEQHWARLITEDIVHTVPEIPPSMPPLAPHHHHHHHHHHRHHTRTHVGVAYDTKSILGTWRGA